MTIFPDRAVHPLAYMAIPALLLALSSFCLTGNLSAGEEFKPDFFRGVKVGQEFRCEAKAAYLAEYCLGGAGESVKTPFKNIQLELAGILTVIQTAEAQPAGLELKIEKFACLENGVKYQPGLNGSILFIRRNDSGKTVFAFKASGDAVAAKDSSLLGMIFDLGTLEPAGKTVWGYPGVIHLGNTWMPDMEVFRGQLRRLKCRPEKLDGRVALKGKQVFRGIDCLLLEMNIDGLLAGGETCAVASHALFPVNNAVYGPVKTELRILRRRQLKLPEAEPLTAGQIMQSEEKFQLETMLFPIKFR